jgi:hypothetical protein
MEPGRSQSQGRPGHLTEMEGTSGLEKEGGSPYVSESQRVNRERCLHAN